MFELKYISYEEARAEHFRALMKKMQRKIDWWKSRENKLRPLDTASRWHIDMASRSHIECSEAGMQYNFYKDALEALENNKFQCETGFVKGFEAAQPKWISVEERLPEDCENVLVYIASEKEGVDSVIAITHYTHSMHGFNIEGWVSPWQYCFWDRKVTHWMPLPSTEGIE